MGSTVVILCGEGRWELWSSEGWGKGGGGDSMP